MIQERNRERLREKMEEKEEKRSFEGGKIDLRGKRKQFQYYHPHPSTW